MKPQLICDQCHTVASISASATGVSIACPKHGILFTYQRTRPPRVDRQDDPPPTAYPLAKPRTRPTT